MNKESRHRRLHEGEHNKENIAKKQQQTWEDWETSTQQGSEGTSQA